MYRVSVVALFVAASLFAATADGPMLLREFEKERSSGLYLRGVIDSVNGINSQQRLLGREPIFCPPEGASPITLARAESIIGKYIQEAHASPSGVIASLPAAELVISQLRFDYPCSQRALSQPHR